MGFYYAGNLVVGGGFRGGGLDDVMALGLEGFQQLGLDDVELGFRGHGLFELGLDAGQTGFFAGPQELVDGDAAFGLVAAAAGGDDVVGTVGAEVGNGHDVVESEGVFFGGLFAAVAAFAAVPVVDVGPEGGLVQRPLLVLFPADLGIKQFLDVEDQGFNQGLLAGDELLEPGNPGEGVVQAGLEAGCTVQRQSLLPVCCPGGTGGWGPASLWV